MASVRVTDCKDTGGPGKRDCRSSLTEWYGGAFDPEGIDEQRIRLVLGMFAARRRGPLASHRSGNRGGFRDR